MAQDIIHFFRVWTPEMAYVLGVLYADGCLTTRHGVVAELALEMKDINYLKLVAHTIDPNLRVHLYTRKDGRETAKVSTGVKSVINDCMALGLRPRKSLDIHWPLSVPEEYERDFVRGFFDGDGCFSWSITGRNASHASKRRVMSFACGNEPFANTLREVIQKHTGAEGSITHYTTCFTLFYLRKESVQAIGEWMYSDRTLYMARKYAKWREVLLPMSEHPSRGLATYSESR